VLRYKEKEDLEARLVEVDEGVQEWRARKADAGAELQTEFRKKLLISLIYHDAALEGEVLSHSEIKAATDANIISDASLIPAYEEIKGFHRACHHGFQLAGAKKKTLKLDSIRELCALLEPETEPPATYRKENPLHRLYYHDIAPPEKIYERMKEFGVWIEGAAARELHPIQRAAESHYRLMAIFPWSKQSGRVARILANIHLEQADYPIAVIHSIDRQRYYEALRSGDSKGLFAVYLEAVETMAASAVRVYDEALAGRRTKAS